MKTGDDFRTAVSEHGIISWLLPCGRCSKNVGFTFVMGPDPRCIMCGCDPKGPFLEKSKWNEVAIAYGNIEKIGGYDLVKKIRNFWHFDVIELIES